MFRNEATGLQEGSRKIDPFTRDYVLDDFGRAVGINSVQHLVQMAIHTERGSSAMTELGQQLRKIDRVTDNVEQRVDTTLRAALKHLIDQGLIAILKIETLILNRLDSSQRPGRVFVRLLWRDLSTSEEQESIV